MVSLEDLRKIDVDSINPQNVKSIVDRINDFDPGDMDVDGDAEMVLSLYDAIIDNQKSAHEELEKEVKKFKENVEELENENQRIRQTATAGGGGGDLDSQLAMQNEIERVRKQADAFEEEIKKKDVEISRLSGENADLNSKKQELERQTVDLEAEKRDLLQRTNMLQERIDKTERGGETKTLVLDLNQHVRKLKADLDFERQQRSSLEERLAKCQRELEEGTAEMEGFNARYHDMQAYVEGKDAEVARANDQVEVLRAQVQELQDEVAMLRRDDDNIMNAVNDKVEEWRKNLDDKDEELREAEREIQRLRSQLTALNVDVSKDQLMKLQQRIQEKDQMIEELRQEISEGTDECNRVKEMLEAFQADQTVTGTTTVARQADRIGQLISENKALKLRVEDEQKQLQEQEDSSKELEERNAELTQRNDQIVAGVFGLKEAVDETKAKEREIDYWQRMSAGYVEQINQLSDQVDMMRTENGMMRDRLGIGADEVLDTDAYRRQKAVQQEEDSATILVLQKEVESLEDERMKLKWQVKSLAKQAGGQAGQMGLSGNLLVFESLMEAEKAGGYSSQGGGGGGVVEEMIGARSSHGVHAGLPPRGFDSGGAETGRSQRSGMGGGIEAAGLRQELARNAKEFQQQERKVGDLESRNKQLAEENEVMEEALKQLKDSLESRVAPKNSAGVTGASSIECPALDKFLAAIEAKKVLGEYDGSMYLKTRLDHLQGRYDEVRLELRESRAETSASRLQLDKVSAKAERLQNDLNIMKNVGAASKTIFNLTLPEDMTQSSQETINSLTEQLVQSMADGKKQKELVLKLEARLQHFKGRYAVMRHQQSLLYADHLKHQADWQQQKQELGDKLEALRGERQTDETRLKEFDRLLDTLQQQPDEQQRRIVEVTRQITVLRCNEQQLVRRFTTLQEAEATLRRENSRLKSDFTEMEKTVCERLGYYKRFKETAAFKVGALQRALDDCVPREELDRLQRKFDELTEKYRDFLEKNNSLVHKSETFDQMEMQVRQLQLDNESLKKSLTVEKERRHLLEAAMEELGHKGVDTNLGVNEESLVSVSKKVSMLEMKELNERERADHATRLYESQRLQLQQLEARNKELEDKFAELTARNLEAQKAERQLRDALATCVTKEASDRDRKKVAQLEDAELRLKQEVERLREVSDIALSQAKTFREQHVSQEKELTSLRQQLLDFQCQSDEKTVIGKLHRHIVQLQLSETTALRKLEDGVAKSRRLEAQLLRLEQRVDERDESLYQTKLESRSKTKQLKETVNSLRSQFAGCVPLAKQERFTKTLLALQEEKMRVKRLLTEAEEEKYKADDELLKLTVRNEGLEELNMAMREGSGAKKVAEWHQRMEQLRLQELKQKRACDRLQQQVKHLEGVVRSQEVLISQLEEESVRQSKDFEERELMWEQREAEFERMAARLDKASADITGTAQRLGRATSDLPDSDLPLPQQLEQAVSTIRKKIKAIFDLEADNKRLKLQMQEVEETLKDKERALIKKERFINELRLRLPATDARDSQFNAAMRSAEEQTEQGNGAESFVEAKTLYAAQTTVASLQARLQQKEESLAKYKELLKGAQDDLEQAVRRHHDELRVLKQRLLTKEDESAQRLHASLQAADFPKESITKKHVKKLHELQELLQHEQQTAAQLQNELRDARREADNWRLNYDTAQAAFDEERRLLQEEVEEERRRCTDEVATAKQEVVDKSTEVQELKAEVRHQKAEFARGPSATMKNLVKKMELQLEEKEKQQRALSKALTDLRSDMVFHAEETSKLNNSQHAQERDLQHILEKHTKDIAEELELTKERVFKNKAEMRKMRDEKEAAQQLSEELRAEMGRKEAALQKLRAEKNKVEQEVEEMARKVERVKSAKRSSSGDREQKTEIEELRRKVRSLEQQQQQQPEKPFEDNFNNFNGKHDWEERKKQQRTIDRLKERLQQQQVENERLQRQQELTKNALERAQKSSFAAPLATTTTKQQQQPNRDSISVSRLTGSRLQVSDADVREKNFQLEEEVSRLRYQLHTLGDQRDRQQLQGQVERLHERCEQLQRQLRLEKPEFSVEVQRMREQQLQLEEKLAAVVRENADLTFEVDQARRDLPRLKDRVNHLTKYVDLLKQEKAALEAAGNTARSSTSSMSNIRRIGDSGKSTKELEKMISRLKKVVMRSEAENERLKRAPGPVSQETLQHLRQENDSLRAELSELRSQMGTRLAERYDAKEKGTAKLMADYERVRKELQRECGSHDKTRQELERLKAELRDAQGRFQAPVSDAADDAGGDGEQVKLAADLAASERAVSVLKQQLRQAAEQERNWKVERQMLLQRLGSEG